MIVLHIISALTAVIHNFEGNYVKSEERECPYVSTRKRTDISLILVSLLTKLM